MKRIAYVTFCAFILLTSCKEDEKVFEKSSAQRSSDAIASLKEELTANPWKVKYQPEDGSGSFWVLMEFFDDNKVHIRSDLDADDNRFFDQTITYRIDSSLGLELIIESHSFFSFLFELDDASFGAEYEFLYANKTPDGELVFASKTDASNPTILLFQEADNNDDSLLGQELSTNITLLSEDLDRFSSSNKLTYVNRDLTLFISLEPLRRTLSIGSGARKSDPGNSELLDFSTGYFLQGDSIIFHTPFADNVTGISVKIKGIKLNTLGTADIADVCAAPLPIHTYTGVTSSNDAVILEPTILDATGAGFMEETSFMYAAPQNMFRDGSSLYTDVTTDIEGVGSMQLYWDINFGTGVSRYALGFSAQNDQGQTSFVLKHFEPVVESNHITFVFDDDFTIYDAPNDADLDKMDYYIDLITEGNATYVYKYAEGIYEFSNPCTKTNYAFFTQ
jgi:hypothetical protein